VLVICKRSGEEGLTVCIQNVVGTHFVQVEGSVSDDDFFEVPAEGRLLELKGLHVVVE
jgi:hypothetical protein